MRLTLPWPPSANTYWRHNRGRTHISERGKAFRRQVIATASPARTIDSPISVTIDLYPPDARRRDVDNTLKATLDALQHAGVYRDDTLIEELTVRRRDRDRPNGRMEVEITMIA